MHTYFITYKNPNVKKCLRFLVVLVSQYIGNVYFIIVAMSIGDKTCHYRT